MDHNWCVSQRMVSFLPNSRKECGAAFTCWVTVWPCFAQSSSQTVQYLQLPHSRLSKPASFNKASQLELHTKEARKGIYKSSNWHSQCYVGQGETVLATRPSGRSMLQGLSSKNKAASTSKLSGKCQLRKSGFGLHFRFSPSLSTLVWEKTRFPKSSAKHSSISAMTGHQYWTGSLV